MFQTPVRVVQTLRPNVAAGVLAATAVSTVVFSATPFLVRGVAVDQDVSVATVGLISTAQLAGFSLTTWAAGRYLRARRRMLVIGVLLGIAANLASGWAPWFSFLIGARVVSGVSLGLIAWISWAEVFGDDEKVGDIAVIGPLVGTVGSPVIAAVIDRSGPDALFYGLAALHVLPLFFIRNTRLEASTRQRQARHRPTRAAAAILVALGMITCGGSAVFVFAGVIGQDDVGLSALAVSLVFSANALASVPSARYRGTRKLPGFWMAVTGAAAIVVGAVHHPAAFWIALPCWGFSFWMGTPGAFSLLAERSKYPAERAGDAQSIMAAGRVIGPLIGGAAYAISPELLGVVGGGIMVAAAVLMLYVEWRIHPEVLGELIGT
ncbi:MAG: MFS transporter [Ilumatobacter sp.]|nr:MFS transporter [Ilumatobacter sp.]